MNRLFDFSTGTLMTFIFSHSLFPSDLGNILIRQLLSLAGGILSTIVIARLKRRWDNRLPPSAGV
ncbi:hypothetical protein [Odoribacter lunatus]|uniref:hypothetical protein n=1 Tax=Odoribacter lunatus TaxID=2941335 RepID=UPI00203E23A5|nr:hypothetical protein [Odoribacter lunatus]